MVIHPDLSHYILSLSHDEAISVILQHSLVTTRIYLSADGTTPCETPSILQPVTHLLFYNL